MKEIKIDEATGLPELPEGQFWDIQEDFIAIRENAEPSEWRDALQPQAFYDNFAHTRETRAVIRMVEKKSWMRKVTVGEPVLQVRDINQSQIVRSKKYGEWDTTYSPIPRCVESDPVTRENIVERCTEILFQWEMEKARQGLYGHYPPNKLEAF